MQKKFTKEQTDIVKGIAILLIVCHHVFWNELCTSAEASQCFIFPFLTELCTRWGFSCNHVFAGITGYGLAAIVSRMQLGVGSIWYRRELSLVSMSLPVYVLASVVYIITSGFQCYITVYQKPYFLNILLDALGGADIFKMNMLNPTWWYFGVSHFFVTAICLIILVLRFIKQDNKVMYLIVWTILVIVMAVSPILYFNVLLAAWTGFVIFQFDIIDRISSLFGKYRIGRVLELVCIVGVSYVWFLGVGRIDSHYISAIFLPLIFMVLVTDFIQYIPIVNTVLAYIGHYSGYIFMLHTFVYSVYRFSSKFVFSFKYAGITYIMVVGISLILGILFDFAEEKLGYKNFVKRLRGE